MAWNRSDGNKQTAVKSSARGSSRVRGLIAAVVVVAGAVGAWLFISPSPERMTADEGKASRRIKGVTPASISNVVRRKAQAQQPALKPVFNHPPTNQWGNPWHWGPQKLRPAHTSRIDRASQPLYMRVFKNGADRAIAALLTIEPGTPLVGGDAPAPMFEQTFQKALKEPVLVLHDDSEEVKELKRAVNETKADLKARVDAGEDIVKIMTDARRELRELGAYREELRKQVEEYRYKGDVTADDLHDMVEAANKMLKERGLKDLSVPEFYYRNLETRLKFKKGNN